MHFVKIHPTGGKYMSQEKRERCEGKDVYCDELSRQLQPAEEPNNVGLLRSDNVVTYRDKPRNFQVVLNYCPWCGERIG